MLRFLGATIAACAALIGPVAILWPSALVANTIMFPLGLANIKSRVRGQPAAGSCDRPDRPCGSHVIAIALLILAGLGIVVSLVLRPPRDVPAATWRLVIGLTLMFLLAPATRFGYFIYPAALVIWLQVSLATRKPPETSPDDAGLAEPAGRQMAESGSRPGASPASARQEDF